MSKKSLPLTPALYRSRPQGVTAYNYGVLSHHLGPIFPLVDISLSSIVSSVPKRSALETVRRELIRSVRYGVRTILTCLDKKTPKGGVIYAVAYGKPYCDSNLEHSSRMH